MKKATMFETDKQDAVAQVIYDNYGVEVTSETIRGVLLYCVVLRSGNAEGVAKNTDKSAATCDAFAKLRENLIRASWKK